MKGGEGTDWAMYSSSDTGLTVTLLYTVGQTGEAAGDTFDLVENLSGSNYDDFLGGDPARNEIRGLFGNDTLYGHRSADTLYGGPGDDVLLGGADSDVLDGGEGFDVAGYTM